MNASPSDPQTPPTPPPDVSDIARLPVETELETDIEFVDWRELSETLLTQNAEMSEQLASAEAELSKLAGRQTVDQVKATLLAPYSSRVFWFVVWYCVAVGVMLLMAGFKEGTHFELSDTILGIIAGSTAVSVIGLIGMVISGLFGAGKRD